MIRSIYTFFHFVKPFIIFAQLFCHTTTFEHEVMWYVLIHLFLHES